MSPQNMLNKKSDTQEHVMYDPTYMKPRTVATNIWQ